MATKSIAAPVIFPYNNNPVNAQYGAYSTQGFNSSGSYITTTHFSCSFRLKLSGESSYLPEPYLVIGSSTQSSVSSNTCSGSSFSAYLRSWHEYLLSLGYNGIKSVKSDVESLAYNYKGKLAFKIKSFPGSAGFHSSYNVFFVDWNEPYIIPDGTTYSTWNYNSNNADNFVLSGYSYEEPETGGDSGTEQPSGSTDLSGVEHAIYMIPATMFCIGFFIVVYRMFMRLRG